ncbi:hypothetical protein N7490_008297 [Penicillium lividum]|nr:hypothetical protein N7490_008297 [Penicillium lividum]
MTSMKQTKVVGIIGPAGFGGSYLAVELLRRQHIVVGISRNPQKFGVHERYIPRSVDVEKAEIDALADQLRDLDVLVSEYGPHTQGADALQYMPYVETVFKLILAVKKAKVKYFVFVGGAGSLLVPGTSEYLADHHDFFPAYRRQLAQSEAHVQYMEERLGPLGSALRTYRTAIVAMSNGTASSEHQQAIATYEENLQKGDRASNYIKAGRAALLFFEGNISFQWTFVSPSPMYRPGRRTGQYEVSVDYLPLKGSAALESLLGGRLTGISVADLAVAIADEIENPKLVRKHWTATGDLSEDVYYPSYIKADAAKWAES